MKTRILAALVFVLFAFPSSAQQTFTPDPRIQWMIDNVSRSALTAHVASLSGETTTTIGGAPFRIETRHTLSGPAISMATQYIFEYMQEQGLTVSYHDWTWSPVVCRNVIATKTGTTRPSEIVLVAAHVDDMPAGLIAPGADDNASGVAAVMAAAAVSSTHHFERTIRFVIFTGEEQGLYGSKRYAELARLRGDNIVAVLNIDMIGWNTGPPVAHIHTRMPGETGYAGDMAIANLLAPVIEHYGLTGSLIPVTVSDANHASDHYPFWTNDYPAVMFCEDFPGDLSPYYHTINDRLSTFDPAYFESAVKAAIGMMGHLAIEDTVNSAQRGWELYQ